MKLVLYIKKNGLKHTFSIIYQYKVDLVIRKVMNIFLKNKQLKNIIVIESHDDFDSNGGALYEYLIRNGFNKKYKIVWLLKHKIPKNLPENVEAYHLYRPSIKKDYCICLAKYLTADNTITDKVRKEQKSYYLSHGAVGFKKCDCAIPQSVDYVLMPSKIIAPISVINYKLPFPDKRLIYVGYPVHDYLYQPSCCEKRKITDKEYNKMIIWMPTFRKGGGFKRNDSSIEQKLGVPLFKDYDSYERFNDFLKSLNVLLVIKIHPMQNLENLKISSLSNIEVLTGERVKKLKIDNYRLLVDSDALISDYSSIAIEYLHIDKPLAYVLEDIKEYVGFVVDPHQLMAGTEIYTIDDMKEFIKTISNEKDYYRDERNALFNKIYKFHDGGSCKRLVEFMKL